MRTLTLAICTAWAFSACCPSCFLHDDAEPALALRSEAPAGHIVFRYTPDEPVESVHLTGDFLDWRLDGRRMDDPDGDGTYETSVRLPNPGEYQYKFVIDREEWVEDPLNSRRVANDFGSFNSVLVVTPE